MSPRDELSHQRGVFNVTFPSSKFAVSPVSGASFCVCRAQNNPLPLSFCCTSMHSVFLIKLGSNPEQRELITDVLVVVLDLKLRPQLK